MWPMWKLFVALMLLVGCKAALNGEDYNLLEELTKPDVNTNIEQQDAIKSCGNQKVCVKKAQCKSEVPDSTGYYSIQFRSALDDNPCHYLEVCCNIADKIEPPSLPQSINNEDFPACGFQHVHGINMTLNETPNREAEFGEFPWMVALMMVSEPNVEPELIGGGSIIAPNIVLTAAHKVHNLSTQELVIRAGEWDLKTKLEMYPHVDRAVKQVVIHENYVPRQSGYNIALIVLKVRFSPNPHIAPICLPISSDSFDSTGCIVTGWGKKNYHSSDYPQVLKEIPLSIVSRENCNAQLGAVLKRNYVLDSTSICAGGEKGIDCCIGDGGAPLVCPIIGFPNRYYQVGIVSWGLQCGLDNIPAVYTDVTNLKPWITQELKKLNIRSHYYSSTPQIIMQ